MIFTTARLQKVYEKLVKQTFDFRVRYYLEQIATKGFFEYDGAKFFPNGDVLINNQKINLHTAKIWRKLFKLVLKEATGIFGRKQRINTDIDQDIFFALLKKIIDTEKLDN